MQCFLISEQIHVGCYYRKRENLESSGCRCLVVAQKLPNGCPGGGGGGVHVVSVVEGAVHVRDTHSPVVTVPGAGQEAAVQEGLRLASRARQ